MRKHYVALSMKLLNLEETDVIRTSPTAGSSTWVDGNDYGKDWQW